MRSLTRVALALTVIGALAGGTGWAASIAVNSFEPAVAADGFCSLIEAMENANADAAIHLDCVAGNGPDAIELMAGEYVVQAVHNEVYGPSGLPAVTGILTINGAEVSQTIIERATGAPMFRLFLVTEGARLTLNHLTIVNGAVEGWRGGGLLNAGGTAALIGCTVKDSQARDGGGLSNRDGSMVLLQTVVNGNRSTRDGGGLENLAIAHDANLVVLQSTVSGNTAEHDGGGLSNAAAPRHTASLKLIESTVVANNAMNLGGGISQFAVDDAMPSQPKLEGGTSSLPRRGGPQMELRVVGGQILANDAGEHGGGIAAWVWPAGVGVSRVDISGGTNVSGNEARHGFGGGLLAWFAGASLVVSEAGVDGNTAGDGRGGGIAVGEDAVLDLYRSTVSRNVADGILYPAGAGGGIEIVAADATIAESTISGNRAVAGGGGIEVASDAGNDRKQGGGAKTGEYSAHVRIADSTIVDNQAGGHGGGIAVLAGSGVAPAELRMVGSILGYNADASGSGNCRVSYPAVLISDGKNAADDTTCWLRSASDKSGGPITGGDLVVADLMLDGLADNGGPTLTHMPLDGSPVIDVGTGAGMRSSIDQRGYPRAAGGGPPGGCICDAGAVEAASEPNPGPETRPYGED